MNILFVHQAFPGQYVHICNQLLKQPGNTVVSVGMRKSSIPKTQGYHHYIYQPKRGNGKDTHPLIVDAETKAIRAEACAELCQQLKQRASRLTSSAAILAGENCSFCHSSGRTRRF